MSATRHIRYNRHAKRLYSMAMAINALKFDAAAPNATYASVQRGPQTQEAVETGQPPTGHTLLLITMPCKDSPSALSRSRPTNTGAPGKILRVNIAAHRSDGCRQMRASIEGEMEEISALVFVAPYSTVVLAGTVVTSCSSTILGQVNRVCWFPLSLPLPRNRHRYTCQSVATSPAPSDALPQPWMTLLCIWAKCNVNH